MGWSGSPRGGHGAPRGGHSPPSLHCPLSDLFLIKEGNKTRRGGEEGGEGAPLAPLTGAPEKQRRCERSDGSGLPRLGPAVISFLTPPPSDRRGAGPATAAESRGCYETVPPPQPPRRARGQYSETPRSSNALPGAGSPPPSQCAVSEGGGGRNAFLGEEGAGRPFLGRRGLRWHSRGRPRTARRAGTEAAAAAGG